MGNDKLEITEIVQENENPEAAQPLDLPPAEIAYLDKVVDRLKAQLGVRLAGVFLFGSASYSAYEPGVSDLDVQAIVDEHLGWQEKSEIAKTLSQDELPCPAAKLEFVCYALQNINPESRDPRFELNLNTGPGLEDHLTLDPGEESSHWFLLDIAMGRETGKTLFGPKPGELFGPIPRLWVLEAILDSLNWHQQHELTSPNSVLNAARGWRYIETSQFGSKQAGAEWALQQPDCPPVVAQALEARRSGKELDQAEVMKLYDVVTGAVRAALASEPPQ